MCMRDAVTKKETENDDVGNGLCVRGESLEDQAEIAKACPAVQRRKYRDKSDGNANQREEEGQD